MVFLILKSYGLLSLWYLRDLTFLNSALVDIETKYRSFTLCWPIGCWTFEISFLWFVIEIATRIYHRGNEKCSSVMIPSLISSYGRLQKYDFTVFRIARQLDIAKRPFSRRKRYGILRLTLLIRYGSWDRSKEKQSTRPTFSAKSRLFRPTRTPHNDSEIDFKKNLFSETNVPDTFLGTTHIFYIKT